MQRAACVGSGDKIDGELWDVKEGIDGKAGKYSRYNMNEGGDPRDPDESSQDSIHPRLARV